MRKVSGIVLIAMAMAGCGSGSARRTPAQEAFIAKADASCRQSSRELARAGLATARRPSDPTARAAELDARVRVRERLLERLRAITAPSSDSESYRRLLATYARRVEALRTSAQAVRLRNAPALRSSGHADAKLNREYVRLSHRLGFRICGAKKR